MNYKFLRLLQVCGISLDFLSLNFVIVCSLNIFDRINFRYSLEYTHFAIWLNIAWLIVSWLGNLYHEKFITSFEMFCRRTTNVFLYWFILLIAYFFLMRSVELSRTFIVMVMVSQALMLVVNRFLYLAIRTYFNRDEGMKRRVLIIGYNETAKRLATYLEEESRFTEVVGFCEDDSHVTELSRHPIIGKMEAAIQASEQYGVEEIFSTIAPEHDLGIYQLMKQADQECIRFRVIPDMTFFMNRNFHVDFIRDIPVLTARYEPLEDRGNRIRKRIFDIGVSLFVTVFILTWLVPLLGLLIWLESPGPIFFKQLRSGRNNIPFTCLKFRSMKNNSESNLRQASKGDDRLTRTGRFIRKTSLDEFPQFINVLLGDMSVVGPRPHMVKQTHDYSKILEEYMVRQFAKPGVTGWAQVNGYRGETKVLEQMQNRVAHDIWYLEHWGLWLDLKIIFLTVFNIFKGEENAY